MIYFNEYSTFLYYYLQQVLIQNIKVYKKQEETLRQVNCKLIYETALKNTNQNGVKLGVSDKFLYYFILSIQWKAYFQLVNLLTFKNLICIQDHRHDFVESVAIKNKIVDQIVSIDLMCASEFSKIEKVENKIFIIIFSCSNKFKFIQYVNL